MKRFWLIVICNLIHAAKVVACWWIAGKTLVAVVKVVAKAVK